MSVGFMGLLTALLAERVSLSIGQWLFVPLLFAGAAGVGYWYWSELQNAGDLRLYVLVQYGSLLWVVLLLLLYPARYSGTRYLVIGLAVYGCRKCSRWLTGRRGISGELPAVTRSSTLWPRQVLRASS